ncbi:glutamine amidotransferase [Psychromicrobium sp. YIM B11713]|uniref:glutamine amidotransferase n=1 Tax=Psychromicrobium sp. YIM B11713 TaxID=3145233 RepID=UPI00374FD19B
MKPFLLLSTRAEDGAALEEAQAFARYTGLSKQLLHWHRLEAAPLPRLQLSDYSGIVLGGSPFNSSDRPSLKSVTQERVEVELAALLDEVVDRDFPFFGACYGVGTLGKHQGAVIDRRFGEPIGPVEIQLTDDGAADPLLAGLPERFQAFVGHKEACSALPSHAVLLASSATSPVQMFRIRKNLYATQFHPELDVAGILTRIEVYQHAGYFPADDFEQVKAKALAAKVVEPARILRNFAQRYGKD